MSSHVSSDWHRFFQPLARKSTSTHMLKTILYIKSSHWTGMNMLKQCSAEALNRKKMTKFIEILAWHIHQGTSSYAIYNM